MMRKKRQAEFNFGRPAIGDLVNSEFRLVLAPWPEGSSGEILIWTNVIGGEVPRNPNFMK